jgi:hypothetical protein
VKARSGRYDLERVLRASLRGSPAVKPVPSPFLRTITLEVDVDVARPIVVKSSLTDVRVGGRLSMLGDLESPEPFGQLALEPGGKVFLQGRAFDVDKGLVIYEGTGTRPWTWRARAHPGGQRQPPVSGHGHGLRYAREPEPGLRFLAPVSEPRSAEPDLTGRLRASSLDSRRWRAISHDAPGRGPRRGPEARPVPSAASSSPRAGPGAKFVFSKRLTRQVSSPTPSPQRPRGPLPQLTPTRGGT